MIASRYQKTSQVLELSYKGLTNSPVAIRGLKQVKKNIESLSKEIEEKLSGNFNSENTVTSSARYCSCG